MSADFLTLNETAQRVSLSTRELLRRRQAGKFPAPVALSARVAGNVRTVLFRTSDVDAWLQARRAGAHPDPFG